MSDTLKTIDKHPDQKIDQKEIEEALKIGFFDNSENVIKIKDDLSSIESNKELVDSFSESLNNALTDILEKEKWSDIDVLIVDLWNNLLGKENEQLRERESKK